MNSIYQYMHLRWSMKDIVYVRSFRKACSGKHVRTLSDWKHVRKRSVWAYFPRVQIRFPFGLFSRNLFPVHHVRSVFRPCSDIVRMSSTKSMSMKEHAYILNTPDETHAWVCFDWVWIKLSWAELWRASRVTIWACSGKHVRESVFGACSDMFGGSSMFGCNSIALQHVRSMFGKDIGHVRMKACSDGQNQAYVRKSSKINL